MDGIGAVAGLACRANFFLMPIVNTLKNKQPVVGIRRVSVLRRRCRSFQCFWAAAVLILFSPSLVEAQRDRVGTASISGLVLDQ